MARDSVTVDFLVETRKSEKDLARIRKEMERIGAASGKAFKGIGGGKGGSDKIRALGTGLSKATVRADEFTKSLEASNARVVAFGASAGIIMQIDRAFKAMVASTIKVEKALLDVNVVLNASQKDLKKFGQGMFQVAKQTAQGFETVAEASVELARQGLGMEKTLSRTNDALILTRLTGMDAAESVKALTAAVNSFNKEGVTSAQVINKMAKVDAAFAVSSEDLANAISRVGASAVSAGVSMDELLAITTAVQQRTARGGAVIGNAFKTIFTRIQRTDVLQKLRNIGVAVTDMEGSMLSGIQVIQNLANNFDSLSRSQQASVSESVAGVFQVNILKAAMADLSSQTSNYSRALKVSNSATDEAYRRNEQLNRSLDALINSTLANLTQAGASLGGGTLEPAIRRTLGFVNTAIESFGKGGAMEGFGETFGKGIIDGIGKFISGPGIAGMTAVIGVLFFKLTKFTGKAFADIMGINKATQQRQAIESAIVTTMQAEPKLLQQVLNKEVSILNIEQQILNVIRKQGLERAAMASIAGPVAGSLRGKGAIIGRSGGVAMGKAQGFIPNFANAGAERASAAAGGYKAGAIRTMNQPGAGSMMYNSAETVKRFPGMSQSAIMPPRNSLAGSNYKSSFSAAHGFNPYAAEGFIPNFLKRPTRDLVSGKKLTGQPINRISLTGPGGKGKQDIGVLIGEGSTKTGISYKNKMKDIPGLQAALAGSKSGSQLLTGELGKRLTPETLFTSFGIPTVSMFPMSMQQAKKHTEGKIATTSLGGLQKALNRYKDQVGAKLFGKYADGTGNDFNTDHLSKGTEGDIFEEAVRAASQGTDIVRSAAFDFDGLNYAPETLMDFMIREGAPLGKTASKVEAKMTNEAAISGNIPKKIVNDLLDGDGKNVGYYKSLRGLIAGIKGQSGLKGKIAASGFIPNFSPLSNAVGREMAAGVPSSAIRVGSSNSLRSTSNPGGLGVYNTIHEPGGLSQGVSRARASGINPKSHGVPNFAEPIARAPMTRVIKEMEKATSGFVKAKKEETRLTETATKSLRTQKYGFAGMAVTQVAALAASGAQGSGMTTPGSMADQALSAGITGLQYGGTAAMINPMAGVLVGITAGLIDFFDVLGSAADSTRNLAKEIEDLAAKEGRTSETFSRIAEEMNKINTSNFGPMRIQKLDEQRNKLFAFVKEEYGDNTKGYADIFKNIENVSTGAGVVDILNQSAKVSRDQGRSLRLQKLLEGGGGTQSGMRVSQGDRGGRFFPNQFVPTDSAAMRSSGLFLGEEVGRANKISTARTRRGASLAASRGEIFKALGGREGRFSIDGPARRITAAEENELLRLDADRSARGATGIAATAGARFLDENEKLLRLERQAVGTSTKRGTLDAAGLISGDAGGQSLLQFLSTSGMRRKSGKYFGRELGMDIFDRDAAMMDLSLIRGGMSSAIETGRSKIIAGHTGDAEAYMAGELASLTGLQGPAKEALVAGILEQARKQAEIGEGGSASEVLLGSMEDLQKSGMSDEALVAILEQRIGAEHALVEAAKEEIKAQVERTKKFKTEIGLLDKLNKSVIIAASGFRHVATMTKIASGQANRMETLRGRSVVSAARSMGDPRSVASATYSAALQAERVRFSGVNTDAKASRDSQIGLLQVGTIKKAVDTILKDALGGDTGLSPEVLRARRKQAQALLDTLGGPKSDLNIKQLQKTFKELGGIGAGEGSKWSLSLKKSQTDLLDAAEGILGAAYKIEEDYANQVIQNKQRNTNNKAFIDETLKLNNQEIDQRFKFQANLRDFNDRVAASLARQQAAEAGSRMGSGKITGAQGAALLRNEMNTRRNSQGLGNMQMEAGQSMMMGFRGEMTYNNRSYLDDLEEGSKSVAASMKSSFADAFKSIASGATDARSAIVQFADGILNTISDVTARIGTNMLFSSMGFSQGGLVPGYNKGGVVTGGSGYKDDVPAMMNGGEFVIKKSAAQKIGYGALNAINSGGAPGYNAGGMFALSAGASMLSGAINQTGQSGPSATRGQNYGQGRGAYGYFGGADVNATGPSSISGGSQSAAISLSKGFNFYRRDPATGRLISERSRPTEGGFDVSSALSLQGRLNQGDPQTERMFSREKSMGDYGNYLNTETARRRDVMKAHEGKKRGRLISAYANAAMLIGGSYFMNRNTTPDLGGGEGHVPGTKPGDYGYVEQQLASGGSAKGSPAMLMGGEYVMSPDTVRTHGLGFMNELNRGGVPSYAEGGFVGGAGGSNNNVNISVNVDRRGNASVESSASNEAKENDQQEIQKNKEFGAALQTVVLQEIMKQQRPGGLLQKTN